MDRFTKWIIIIQLSVMLGMLIAITYRIIEWSANSEMARLYCAANFYGVKPDAAPAQKGGEI